jgi:hypothetical protein
MHFPKKGRITIEFTPVVCLSLGPSLSMKALLLTFCPFFPAPIISVPNEENSLFPFKWGDIWKLPEGEFNC